MNSTVTNFTKPNCEIQPKYHLEATSYHKIHILGKKEDGETYGLKISHEIRKTAEAGAERRGAGTRLLVGRRRPGKAQTSSGWPSYLVVP